jgi:hypothetical protein
MTDVARTRAFLMHGDLSPYDHSQNPVIMQKSSNRYSSFIPTNST